MAATWLLLSALWIAAVIVGTGDVRDGIASHLVDSPRYLAECLAAAVAIALAAIHGLRLSIPALGRPARAAVVTAAAILGWAAMVALGALAPTSSGASFMRPLCHVQAVLLSLPVLIAGVWLVRRRAPTRRVIAGALCGVVAGGLAALSMQLVCMPFDIHHSLVHHFAPGLGVVGLGALAGGALIRRI